MRNISEERLAALGWHAPVLTDTLTVNRFSALTVVNAALMATVGDTDLAAIREATLSGLSEGPKHEATRLLVYILTQSPAVAVVEHQPAFTVRSVHLQRNMY